MQNIASLHADEFPALLARLLPDLDLDQLAIEHKAIQRGRKIKTGTELLRLALAHGPGGMSLRDAAGWSGMLGLGSLSNPAVKYRLDNSVDFLDAVTDHLLAARSASQVCTGRVARYGGRWHLHFQTGQQGHRLAGAWRLRSRRGWFSNLELTDVKGAETLTYGAPVAGEVRIGDRNYGRAKPWHRFLQDSGGRADLIARIKWKGFHLTAQDGSAFDLIDHLATLPNDHLPREIDVQALVQRGVTMPIRLVILRKPREAVEATRKTLRAQASRKQKVLDPRTLIAAEFLILGTSLSAEDYPAVEVLAASRLRWQIELAFKRLKSLLHIDKLPARTDFGAPEVGSIRISSLRCCATI